MFFALVLLAAEGLRSWIFPYKWTRDLFIVRTSLFIMNNIAVNNPSLRFHLFNSYIHGLLYFFFTLDIFLNKISSY